MVTRAIALLLLCVLPACASHRVEGDAGPPGRDLDGALVDAAGDAAVVDPTPIGDAGAPSFDGGPGGEYYESNDGVASDNCFNGDDDDGDGASDCEDRSCRANVPACCVGVSDSLCCEPGEAVSLPIASCDGEVGLCAEIVALAEPFGAPAPTVGERELEARTLVLRGHENDSGLLFDEPLDVRAAAVTLTATIAASSIGHDLGTDFVAVGLVDAESAVELLRVTPRIALMVSGNRHEASLLVAGELVQRWPLVDGSFHGYALTSRPDGTVELRRDGALLGTTSIRFDRPLRAVVYGRSFNPGPTDPAPVRVSAIGVSSEACDVPSALTPERTPVLPAPGAIGWEGVRRVGAPSVARWTSELGELEERMAVEIDGALYLARRGAGGWEPTTALGTPALAASGGAQWLSDPALRWDGSALELFFTARSASGEGSVMRVRAAVGTETFAWTDVEALLDAGEVSYSGPAPFEHAEASYLALAEDEGGASRIALYRLDPITRIGVVRERGEDLFAFDRDALSSPAVVATSDGVLRMYFAGRRGARFGVGMLVSANGLTWVEPSGGALVLDATGAGFDALGVLDPEPVVDGGTLELFYTGLDGTSMRVGLARGPAPPAR